MNQTNPAAQQAARAAAAEQMAAKVAVHQQMGHLPTSAHRRYPMHNTIIVIGVLLAAVGTFIAMVMRGG
jgi:hypothetical protein